jgi:eight-cysteine-cluster-containing protein
VIVTVLAVVAWIGSPAGCDKPREPVPSPDDAVGTPGDRGPGGSPVGGEPGADSPDTGSAVPGDASDRVPMIAADHPLHDRLEGSDFGNACEADAGCFRGGCSGEVCSAEEGVNTTCEVLEVRFPADAQCGCLGGACRWWSPSGSGVAGGPTSAAVPTGHEGTPPDTTLAACGTRTCKPGQACVEEPRLTGDDGPVRRTCVWPDDR